VNRRVNDRVNCVFHAPFSLKDCQFRETWATFAPKIHLRIQSARLSYYIEGKNPPNLTEKIKEIGETTPYS